MHISISSVKPGFAWSTIRIDVVGLLPLSIGRAKYIIFAIEGVTKWVEACAISNLSSFTAAKFIIDQVIVRHGCPQFIKTDNGIYFSSGLFYNSIVYAHLWCLYCPLPPVC